MITGPTGVGKTRYVDRLLEVLPFDVINLDSCQVYAFFKVGTGRSDGAYPARRHLYGFLGPHERLSPASYVQKAQAVVAEIELRGGAVLFEGGSRSLLPALAEAMPLKVFGLRPPAVPGWIEARVARRAEAFFRDDAIVREVQAAIRLGYGDCALMQDPMIYQQTRDFLDGRYTAEGVRAAMVDSMLAMHRDQMRKFDELDIEWADVGSCSPDRFANRVRDWSRSAP